MRTRGSLAALAVPVLLLSACGGASTTKASDHGPTRTSASPAAATSSAPTGPSCASVWRDGATLPAGYAGCVAGGAEVAAQDRECEFGKRLVTYGDHYYAVRSGTVHRTGVPLEKDRGYRAALASCMA